MTRLRITLLSDGNSDQSLVHLLRWLLKSNGVHRLLDPTVIQNAALPIRPKKEKYSPLAWRIKCSLELASCELLFVHRDAEREPMRTRIEEIRSAAAELSKIGMPPVVCVVPVRMQEAWFLFHKEAIRSAASNPNGKMPLEIPHPKEVEDLPDPKDTLNKLLLQASGKTKRRRSSVSLSGGSERIAQYIDDFSPLRRLPAFAEMEKEIIAIIQAQGWNNGTP